MPFETSIFPDGTSQVWKLGDTSEFDRYTEDPEILWMFESEAELMHVLQLAQLVQKELDTESVNLIAPYLPYGRQDKEVGNNVSFALQTFKDILYAANICRIETFDAHSKSDMVYSTAPEAFHRSVIDHDVVCFPDAGANERYKYNFNIDIYQQVCFEKVRNQQTGEITGLKLLGKFESANKSVLIVDDICDGGMTFIKVAQELKKLGFTRIDLAVSHGLFSKGKQVLYDAGINNIYTTNSLLRNPEGFKVVGDDYLR